MTWPWRRLDDRHERPLPVPFRERFKVLMMGAAVAISALWFGARSQDQQDEGAAALVAIGASVAAINVIQLAYLKRTGPAGRIFISNERTAAVVYSIAVAAGIVAMAVGLANGA